MRTIIGASIALLASASVAEAAGGLSCEAKDAQAEIIVEAGVTHGMGGPTFNFRGQAEIKSSRVAADLRKTTFAEEHRPQYWLGDDELRLVLYRERTGDKPHGYVEIVIRAKGDDEGTYAGGYELVAYDTTGDGENRFSAKGKITCFVE